MKLATTTFDILNQLSQLIEQLDDSEYIAALPVISGNTIGKHVRHIVEFYICLLNGLEVQCVNYDHRQRDLQLETDRNYVINTINTINRSILKNFTDCDLKLNVLISETGDTTSVNTTFFRELVYNIEHAVHHFAIIKIAIENSFSDVIIPQHFGVAYSTVKYQQQCAQ